MREVNQKFPALPPAENVLGRSLICLAEVAQKNQPVLMLTKNQNEKKSLVRFLQTLTTLTLPIPKLPIIALPEDKNLIPYLHSPYLAIAKENEIDDIKIPSLNIADSLTLEVNQISNTNIIAKKLLDLGYQNNPEPYRLGEFAVVGGHIVILPWSETERVSIAFDYRTIAQINCGKILLKKITLPTSPDHCRDLPLSDIDNISIISQNSEFRTHNSELAIPYSLTPNFGAPSVASAKLKKLAETSQVILLTHLTAAPQIFASSLTGAIVNLSPDLTLTTDGIFLPDLKLNLITDKTLSIPATSAKTKTLASAASSLPLLPRQYVVHPIHGVGQYLGLTLRDFDNVKKEYAEIAYAGSDKLFVPAEQINILAPYVGSDHPILTRLGSPLWIRANQKSLEEAKKIALALLASAAGRRLKKIAPIIITPAQEKNILAGFAYEDTPDQKSAWEDLKIDLKNDEPTDRLVCGDVGFGKTEMAIRVSIATALAGQQTLVLCPTTILAEQHGVSFLERFEKLGLHSTVLSRLVPPSKQKQILADFTKGNIQCLIGTHRLLTPDIHPQALGLFIIDEEQRFGVKQKEKWLKANPQARLLTLSATPLPRTLNYAFLQLKKISLLTTPPQGRVAVKTELLETTPENLRAALSLELKRGGQSFVLENRLANLAGAKKEIEELLPGARVGILHGQMPTKLLEGTLHNFLNHKLDILVATTLIENGLDIPSVNTLFVADATRYGLSQLHQLRGRVGRRNKRAYFYLGYKPEKKMSVISRARLTTLQSYQQLGAGFAIAQKDMALRGLGNLIGVEQSGHAYKIGLNQYLKYLDDAINELENPLAYSPEKPECQIDFPWNALLPVSLFPDAEVRLAWYRRAGSAQDLDELFKIQNACLHSVIPSEAEGSHDSSKNIFLFFDTVKLRLLLKNIGASMATLTKQPENWFLKIKLRSRLNITDEAKKLLPIQLAIYEGSLEARLPWTEAPSLYLPELIDTIKFLAR